jgi:hypothetical protein
MQKIVINQFKLINGFVDLMIIIEKNIQIKKEIKQTNML